MSVSLESGQPPPRHLVVQSAVCGARQGWAGHPTPRRCTAHAPLSTPPGEWLVSQQKLTGPAGSTGLLCGGKSTETNIIVLASCLAAQSDRYTYCWSEANTPPAQWAWGEYLVQHTDTLFYTAMDSVTG